MADDKPLSDTQAYDRLYAAQQALGTAPGATTRSNTALEAARKAMKLLQVGLLKAGEENADELECIISPEPQPEP